ncbi:hypothetical protein EDD22DRAFT_848069 [Suillus occidentalis]|nr:hypothetical protein EDD22DRAFT_848069 [Suillus occidentalis]
MSYTYISMAKRKKTNSKKVSIKIPAKPVLETAEVGEPTSDKPLEFPNSPVPHINDAERTGHLSEADWSTKNSVEENDEVEVDKLESEWEEEPDYGSDQLVEITKKDSHAASDTALTFVNKFVGNRFVPQGITDAQVDWILGGKQKKGKVRKDTDRGDPSEDEERPTEEVHCLCPGPFKMDTSKTFEMFECKVVEVLPCQTSMLPVVKFEWKFDNQAQSAPCKKIANRAGYEALLDAINVKRVADNVVVWLYTPKPAKDKEDWDTRNPDYVKEPFDFDQEADSRSHKSLISDMATKWRLAEEELEKEYPLGHYAKFPHKWVWHNRNDTYFELTPVQVRFWANSIAAGKADKSAPPLSVHFTDKKKLKVPLCVPPPPNAPPTAFAQYYQQCQEEATLGNPAPAPPAQAGPPPFPIPGPGGFPLHGYQPYFTSPYMQAPYMGGYPYPPPYGPAFRHQPFAGPEETLSASSSLSITTSHNVSLS